MKRTLFVLLSFALLTGCGAQPETYRVVFTPGPGQDLAGMQEKYGPTLAYMEERTGYRFEMVVASSYEAAIEDLRNRHSQIMRGAPAAYVMASEQMDVELLGREVVKGSGSYVGLIIAKPGIFVEPYGLPQIRGHSVAFVDPESTSGFLMARAMMRDAGVVLEDLGEYAFLGEHPAVIEAVINGAVDVGATCDRRLDLAVEAGAAVEGENYVVLAVSPPITLNPWFVSIDVPEETRGRIRAALLSVSPEILEPSGTDDIVEAVDADYDFVRLLIRDQ